MNNIDSQLKTVKLDPDTPPNIGTEKLAGNPYENRSSIDHHKSLVGKEHPYLTKQHFNWVKQQHPSGGEYQNTNYQLHNAVNPEESYFVQLSNHDPINEVGDFSTAHQRLATNNLVREAAEHMGIPIIKRHSTLIQDHPEIGGHSVSDYKSDIEPVYTKDIKETLDKIPKKNLVNAWLFGMATDLVDQHNSNTVTQGEQVPLMDYENALNPLGSIRYLVNQEQGTIYKYLKKHHPDLELDQKEKRQFVDKFEQHLPTLLKKMESHFSKPQIDAYKTRVKNVMKHIMGNRTIKGIQEAYEKGELTDYAYKLARERLGK